MRIALVHPYSWPTVRRGGERYLHDLARWLLDAGHEVDVVTGATADPPTSPAGARFVQLPLLAPARLAPHGVSALDTFGLSVLPHLLRERYDVVHSLVPSGGLAAGLAGRPAVYTVLGHPSPENAPQRRWARALLLRGLRSTRVTTALSASACDGAERLSGRRPLELPPGVRTADFTPKPGVVTGPPRLLFNAFAGDPRKRLRVLIEALPAVLAVHPDARLTLGGGGDVGAVLDALDPATRRAVEPAVDDVGAGALEDVPQRFREATVSVLPSVDEAFGLVLVESLACGTPVVCSRSGGMPEIVTDEVGRVARPDDAASLADAVLQALELARDADVVDRCVARAALWDWDLVGPRHVSAYLRARA